MPMAFETKVLARPGDTETVISDSPRFHFCRMTCSVVGARTPTPQHSRPLDVSGILRT